MISCTHHRVIATWDVGSSPDMLQVSPHGNQLWASNRYDGTASVIDTRSGNLMHTIRIGKQPLRPHSQTARIVAINPTTQQVRIAGYLPHPLSDATPVPQGSRIVIVGGLTAAGTQCAVLELTTHH